MSSSVSAAAGVVANVINDVCLMLAANDEVLGLENKRMLANFYTVSLTHYYQQERN